jgi:hypothetical protein
VISVSPVSMEAGLSSFIRAAPISTKLSPELQQKIAEAKEHLAVAERELEVALNEIESAERADKKMISHRVELGFEKVTSGRRSLEVVLQQAD